MTGSAALNSEPASIACLESDGTVISSDEVLPHFEKEMIMLLSREQQWSEKPVSESYKATNSVSVDMVETVKERIQAIRNRRLNENKKDVHVSKLKPTNLVKKNLSVR